MKRQKRRNQDREGGLEEAEVEETGMGMERGGAVGSSIGGGRRNGDGDGAGGVVTAGVVGRKRQSIRSIHELPAEEIYHAR